MSDGILQFDPDAYPTISRFYHADAYIRRIKGPTGSGKTFACVWRLMGWALSQNPNARKERLYRILVVRNTANLLQTTTFPTFEVALGALMRKPYAKVIQKPYLDVTITLPLPDGTVLLLKIWFRAFDSEESASNALGLEPSAVFIDEDTEFELSVFGKIIIRTGRYPPKSEGGPTEFGVVTASNGSRNNHFLDDWMSGKSIELLDSLSAHVGHAKMFAGFTQPGGLIAPNYDWTSIPIVPKDWLPNLAAENIINLQDAYGYYYKQLVNSTSDIYRYVLGENSPRVAGKPVYPGFKRSRNVVPYDFIDRKREGTIMLSFDYGRTPACLIAVPKSNGGLIIVDEITTEGTSIDGLLRDNLSPQIKSRYNRPTHLFVTGDPSGEFGRDVGEHSPEGVLVEAGYLYEPPPCGNHLETRLEAVRQCLSRLDSSGEPYLQITENCAVLIDGFESSYIYEITRNGIKDAPTKAHPVSDVHDCLQYLCSVHFQYAKRKLRKDKSQYKAKKLPTSNAWFT
jgi:hypothetical protein